MKRAPDPGLTRPFAAASGLGGAGVALIAGDVLSAAIDVSPTPLVAVGNRIVDRFAASLKDFAVAVFGTSDKSALVIGTILVSLIVGALLGLAAPRRRWIPLPGFAAFGALGAWAQLADPRVGAGEAIATAGFAVLVGAGVTELLLRLASFGSLEPVTDDEIIMSDGDVRSRRGFVAACVGISITAVGALAWARSLDREAIVAAAKKFRLGVPRSPNPLPESQPFDVPGLSPYVTPNSDFYRIDTALRVPLVDPETWKLKVHGMVEHPFEIDFAELLAMPSIEETVTLQCVSNEVGGDLVGNATWQGVELGTLLDRAEPQANAEQIFSRSVDGWSSGFPISAATDGRTALVAYAMNGEKLPFEHGFPVRLVVAGLYGYVSATKWLSEIELTTWEGSDGYWVPRGWSKKAPIKLASRIDVPRSGATVRAGEVVFAGVAWMPDTGISRVEVSIDDDDDWLTCDLGNVAGDNTWVQWRCSAKLSPGRHTATVRAVDAHGNVQTSEIAPTVPDGATGLHRVGLTVSDS